MRTEYHPNSPVRGEQMVYGYAAAITLLPTIRSCYTADFI